MTTLPTNGNDCINGDVSPIISGTQRDDIFLLDGAAHKDNLLGGDGADNQLENSCNDLLDGGAHKVTIVFWSRQ